MRIPKNLNFPTAEENEQYDIFAQEAEENLSFLDELETSLSNSSEQSVLEHLADNIESNPSLLDRFDKLSDYLDKNNAYASPKAKNVVSEVKSAKSMAQKAATGIGKGTSSLGAAVGQLLNSIYEKIEETASSYER